MKSNYPYIIAGLPYLLPNLDNFRNEGEFSAQKICSSISENCSKEDNRLIRFLKMGLESHNLNTLFYRKCAQSGNGFIRDYFAFDLEIRNIAAAYSARKYALDIKSCLLGESILTQVLANSTAEDFDLKNVSEYGPAMHRIMQIEDPLSRERELDTLRWQKAESLTLSHILDIDIILAFITKAYLAQRWSRLDSAKGVVLFRQMIQEIKQTYHKAQ